MSSQTFIWWIVILCRSTSVLIHIDLFKIWVKLCIRKQIKFCILAVLGVGFFHHPHPLGFKRYLLICTCLIFTLLVLWKICDETEFIHSFIHSFMNVWNVIDISPFVSFTGSLEFHCLNITIKQCFSDLDPYLVQSKHLVV